ncbi:cobalamin biosynthesis protein [Escherichia fergusonii]|uniref:cobalamin biosynthesis protein n=1 Tax=Escherichia fergusonii TaxID=564 RepID=UPI00200C04ED|nr:cobalamin biosynthesis protein [Escherichia fergusonii]
MQTIKPDSIALFCFLQGGINLANRLADVLPITCFIGEEWQQEFLPFNGGPAQSLRDAFTDYSVLIFIANSATAVPEISHYPEGPALILIEKLSDYQARALASSSGKATSLIQYLNNVIAEFRYENSSGKSVFCQPLIRGYHRQSDMACEARLVASR